MKRINGWINRDLPGYRNIADDRLRREREPRNVADEWLCVILVIAFLVVAIWMGPEWAMVQP